MSTVVRRLSAGAVAAGDEGVWALGLDSSLARIDPATASVDKRIRVAANTLSAIAVGAGAVWAAAPYDGTVWRVDPGPRLVQRTIDVGAGVTDVAYGRGSVWALNSLRGTVSRIDPETNRVAATVRLGNTPRQIAVGSAGVWVTVAGAAGAPVAAAADAPKGGPALPAATADACSTGVAVSLPTPKSRRGPRYTPVSRRQDRRCHRRLLRNHAELPDAAIMKLVGTTKPTIQSIRDRTHWNSVNIKPVDPVTLGLCSQLELDLAVRRAARKSGSATVESGATNTLASCRRGAPRARAGAGIRQRRAGRQPARL